MYVMVFNNTRFKNFNKWLDDDDYYEVYNEYRRDTLKVTSDWKVTEYTNDNKDLYAYLFYIDGRISNEKIARIWGDGIWLTDFKFVITEAPMTLLINLEMEVIR